MDLALAGGRGHTPLARMREDGPLVSEENVVAVGIRDGDFRGSKIRTATHADDVLAKLGDRPFFVHVDTDVLDPSVMPFVDSPEPDGMFPDELVDLLRAFGVTVLVDIRTIPRSRHNPQFEGTALRASLRSRRIRCVHLAELGGLRRARKDSPNDGWRNASFRGYADYMATEDFEAGLAKLHALVADGTVALMCAEAVPWRCHRSLVADALVARGAVVEHITSTTRASPHRMTPFARVRGTRVTYPSAGPEPE
jgi:hypothetical protein